jgi:hypothetical protein
VNSTSDLARNLAADPRETREIAIEYVATLNEAEARTLAEELLWEEVEHRRREQHRTVEVEDFLTRRLTPEKLAQHEIWKAQTPMADAERHMAAIKLINEAHAECLNDVNHRLERAA